ncbi:MAG: succinate dehydrogenase iron-sulfur subunit [Pseudomonadota bacterium]
MDMHFKIQRFNPRTDEKPYFREYDLDLEPGDRILDGLNKIKWELDGTLVYRLSCAHGVCGSCAVRINGRCALACQALAGQFRGVEVVIEPLPSFRVLRDLIVDLEPFLARVASVRPFLVSHLPPPEKERLQSPEDRKKIDEVIRCILCGCCTAACPVTAENGQYLGPAPLVQAFRRIFDSRDDEKVSRLEQVNSPDGAFGCVNHFECTRVCPKEIKVTKAINTIKREIERAGKKV